MNLTFTAPALWGHPQLWWAVAGCLYLVTLLLLGGCKHNNDNANEMKNSLVVGGFTLSLCSPVTQNYQLLFLFHSLWASLLATGAVEGNFINSLYDISSSKEKDKVFFWVSYWKWNKASDLWPVSAHLCWLSSLLPAFRCLQWKHTLTSLCAFHVYVCGSNG